MAQQFFTWRSAFMKSPLPPLCKLILHTISTYMNDHGDGAFPSLQTLADDSGISERWVRKQIGAAVESGFLSVHQHGFGDRRWRRNQYFIAFPAEGQPVVSKRRRIRVAGAGGGGPDGPKPFASPGEPAHRAGGPSPASGVACSDLRRPQPAPNNGGCRPGQSDDAYEVDAEALRGEMEGLLSGHTRQSFIFEQIASIESELEQGEPVDNSVDNSDCPVDNSNSGAVLGAAPSDEVRYSVQGGAVLGATRCGTPVPTNSPMNSPCNSPRTQQQQCAHVRPVDNFVPTVFQMHHEWEPRAETIEHMLKRSGMGEQSQWWFSWPSLVPEFAVFWAARNVSKTQGEWEAKLYTQIQYGIRTNRACPIATPIPIDWQPDDQFWVLLADQEDIDITFAEGLVGEFVLYWRERGGEDYAWIGVFLSWVRKRWATAGKWEGLARRSLG